MIRRAILPFVAVACACAVALLVPTIGTAASGGVGVAPPAGQPGATPGTVAQPGDVTVAAAGDGMRIASRASALLRGGLQVSGSVPRSDAGKRVVIERSGARTGWTWEATVQTTARSDGTFTATTFTVFDLKGHEPWLDAGSEAR